MIKAAQELKETFNPLTDPASQGDDVMLTVEMAAKIVAVAERYLLVQSIIDNNTRRKPKKSTAHFAGTANCGPDCCEAR